MDVWLVMIGCQGRRRRFALAQREMVVGRARDCELRVALPCVSRRHCKLERDEHGSLAVRDLSSLNGTWINGRRVEQARLAAGDRLRIGPVVFQLMLDLAPPSDHAAPEVVVAGTKH